MIYIKLNAQKYFLKLLLKKKYITQLRINLINKKILNKNIIILYCINKNIKINDINLVFYKIILYINKLIIIHLHKIIIYYIKNQINSKIILNIKKKKINKFYSLFLNIKKYIKLKINPKLYLHNGKIILIRINKNMNLILKFKGNCNNCSIMNITFKNEIEIKIINNFSLIRKIFNISNYF